MKRWVSLTLLTLGCHDATGGATGAVDGASVAGDAAVASTRRWRSRAAQTVDAIRRARSSNSSRYT